MNIFCKKQKTQKHTAFTLAEVLIVLGIIGIVAEITIPTLMNNVQNEQYKAGLKKSFSIINQSYLSLKSDNAGSIINACAINDSACLANLFKPYLRFNSSIAGVPNNNELSSCWLDNNVFDPQESHACLMMNDGMTIDFDMEYSSCDPRCSIVNVDVNGPKKPNKWGKDRYGFVMYDDSIKPSTGGSCQDGSGAGLAADNWGCAYKNLYQ